MMIESRGLPPGLMNSLELKSQKSTMMKLMLKLIIRKSLLCDPEGLAFQQFVQESASQQLST
jgi:hypothetical protein